MIKPRLVAGHSSTQSVKQSDELTLRRQFAHRSPGGLFVLHARALPDNPYDGHTLY